MDVAVETMTERSEVMSLERSCSNQSRFSYIKDGASEIRSQPQTGWSKSNLTLDLRFNVVHIYSKIDICLRK